MYNFQVCTLTEFLLDTVSLETYSDTPSEHLPSLFLQIVTLLTEHCDTLSPIQTAKALQLCAKILTRVQPAVVAHSQSEAGYTSTDQSESSLQISSSKTTSVKSLPGKVERSDISDSTSFSSDSERTGRDSSQSKELPRIDKCATVETQSNILEQCLRQYER